MKPFLLSIFTTTLAFAINAQTYGIKADYLIDGHSDKISKNPIVFVSKNRIVEVSFSKDIPDSVQLIDLEGYTILPGLIDAHTHLLVSGGGFTEYENDNYRYSTTFRSLRAVSHLKTSLHNGFTTIRDVCTEGAGYADVDLAKSVRFGHIDGPRIFPSTKGIAITGNYMPPPMAQNWELEMPSGAQYVSGKDECQKATREQIANGAQWIKVFVDWWHVTFNLDELTTIVNEAKKSGVNVAAHATYSDGIALAIEAGVKSIEHGDGFTDELIKKAIEKDIFLCPTITFHEHDNTDKIASNKRFEMLSKAYKMGLKIVLGSDVGSYPWEVNQAKELEYYVKNAGFSPMDAIKSGTSLAAELLERSNDLGQIKKGYIADIIAVKGNPLEDITLLQKVDFVMKDGKIYKNEIE